MSESRLSTDRSPFTEDIFFSYMTDFIPSNAVIDTCVVSGYSHSTPIL